MKKSSVSLYFLAFCMGVLWLSGCYYDNNEELHPELVIGGTTCDTTVLIKYSTDVQSIMSGSCGANNSCHNSTSSSNINLGTYAGVHTVALNGKLWSAIVWDGKASFMPQGSSAKINDCYQAKILKWINEGSPDN